MLSGDGDFGSLLHRTKQRFGTKGEVYGVPGLTSPLLIEHAKTSRPIDELLLLYLTHCWNRRKMPSRPLSFTS